MEDDSTTHERLRVVVGRCMGVFYADDGMIGSRDMEWLQGAINFLVGIFRSVIMMANVAKSNTITYQLGLIHRWM